MKRKRITTTTYIETHIVTEIEKISQSEGLQKRTTDNLYFIVDSILTRSRQKHDTDFKFVSKSRNYWRKTIGRRYKRYIDLLMDNEVIECNESYSTKSRESKKYKIHPRFQEDIELQRVQYSMKITQNELNTPEMKELREFYEKHIQKFNDNEYIELLTRELSGLSDIQYKMKRRYWESSYENLKRGNLYAHRNKTNNRLDSNFTNMPKKLKRLIMEWNGLGEIDMVNSQPVLMSNMMVNDPEFDKKDEVDVTHFHKLCKSGKLYETLQEKWNLKERDDVKPLIYQIMYSRVETYNDPHKKFEKIFPTVYQYIINTKIQGGNHNQFAIKLQKYESNIWIDKIKTDLNKMNILHTTVHDSVIVEKEKLVMVSEMIKHILNNNNIEGEVNITFDLYNS